VLLRFPAKAGIQSFDLRRWAPAFAGEQWAFQFRVALKNLGR
jgi:hypothetical protein